MFRYGQHLKNCDLVSVGHVCTSYHCGLFHPSTSLLCRLAPYCFNTVAMPLATHPSGLWLLLIAWLDNRSCVHGCLCLYVGVSLPPVSGLAETRDTPPLPFSGGLANQLHPDPYSYNCWLGYRSPSGVCPCLGFLVYMTEVHLPLIHGAVLYLCPAGSWVHLPLPRNGVPRSAMGGLTTSLGLSIFPCQMGLRFSLFCGFVCSLSGISFFGLHICGGFFVHCIQACGFLVVSTHSTDRCFHLDSKWLTSWAESESFSREKRGGL